MPKPTLAYRFWSKIKRKPSGCWEWQGLINPKGYGRFKVNGSMQWAHRVAWILTYGTIPDGLHVLHKCDNPPCCNPKHLFLGTNADNIQDKVQKGRAKKKKEPSS